MGVAFGDKIIDERLADAGNGGEIHNVFAKDGGEPCENVDFTLASL